MKIKYPVAIKTLEFSKNQKNYYASFPDLDSKVVDSDSIEDVLEKAKKLVTKSIRYFLDGRGPVPAPKPLSEHVNKPEYDGYIWTMVEVDGTSVDNSFSQIDINIPSLLCHRMTEHIMISGDVETPSDYVVNAVLERIIREQL